MGEFSTHNYDNKFSSDDSEELVEYPNFLQQEPGGNEMEEKTDKQPDKENYSAESHQKKNSDIQTAIDSPIEKLRARFVDLLPSDQNLRRRVNLYRCEQKRSFESSPEHILQTLRIKFENLLQEERISPNDNELQEGDEIEPTSKKLQTDKFSPVAETLTVDAKTHNSYLESPHDCLEKISHGENPSEHTPALGNNETNPKIELADVGTYREFASNLRNKKKKSRREAIGTVYEVDSYENFEKNLKVKNRELVTLGINKSLFISGNIVW